MHIHDPALSAAVDVLDGEGAAFVGVTAGDLQDIEFAQLHGGEQDLLGDGSVFQPENLAQLHLMDCTFHANQEGLPFPLDGDRDPVKPLFITEYGQSAGDARGLRREVIGVQDAIQSLVGQLYLDDAGGVGTELILVVEDNKPHVVQIPVGGHVAVAHGVVDGDGIVVKQAVSAIDHGEFLIHASPDEGAQLPCPGLQDHILQPQDPSVFDVQIVGHLDGIGMGSAGIEGTQGNQGRHPLVMPRDTQLLIVGVAVEIFRAVHGHEFPGVGVQIVAVGAVIPVDLSQNVLHPGNL